MLVFVAMEWLFFLATEIRPGSPTKPNALNCKKERAGRRFTNKVSRDI